MQQDESNQSAGWVFKPGGEEPVSENKQSSPAPSHEPGGRDSSGVSWSASEYVANPKNANWFYLLAISAMMLALGVYFVTKDLISSVMIVILALIVGVFAARQPRVLEYRVDEHGIQIGPKHFPYSNFKSFSLAEEGAFAYITLMPLRRFMPPLAIHFAPADEEKIIETFSDYLPFEQHRRDIVDSVSRRLRF